MINDKVLKRINKTFIHNKKYRVGKYEILIPSSLNLPNYQKKYPLYDRFLPVLANHFSDNGIIIDVGANIGDTLFAMMQNCNNSFISIEPSTFFFNYLKQNVDSLDSLSRGRVQLIQELVGTGAFSGKIKNNEGSTATVDIIEDKHISTHVPLDKIIKESEKVLLLKSDVDGYDFDVISSAERILQDSEPILFFEDDFKTEFQYERYVELFNFLKVKNYSHFTIFDNFGNIIVEKADYDVLFSIHDYLSNMNNHPENRTFYYIDILMSTDKNFHILENAVKDYKENWIRK